MLTEPRLLLKKWDAALGKSRSVGLQERQRRPNVSHGAPILKYHRWHKNLNLQF